MMKMNRIINANTQCGRIANPTERGEWKEVKLGDICTELSDGLHKAPLFVEGGDYIFVNAKNLCDGVIVDNDPTKKTTHEEYLKYSKPLNENTILFSIDGTIGNIARYKGEKCVLGKGACYINPNPVLVDSSYIYFQLQSPHFNSYLNCMSTGSTIKHISLKTMRNYEFTLPPLPEQRSIASILSALDDKIAVNRRICENLEAQAQALFKHWFIDFAPFKDGKFVESELGMIPEGWRVGTFSEIFDLGPGGTPKTSEKAFWKDGTIPFFSPKDVNGVYCFETEKHITEEGLNNCSSRLYDKNTVFITCRGTVGKVAMAATPMAMNQSNYAILSNKGYSQYFAYLMTVSIIKKLKFKANGAVFDAITTKDFKEQIIIPNLNIVNRFDSIIQPIFDSILNAGFENLRLSTLRDTLLPKLMSGELKVNEIETKII